MKRSSAMTEFLADVLTIAIENGGYGSFYLDEYEANIDGVIPSALITWYEDGSDDHFRPALATKVDIDLIARGIGVIRDAVVMQKETTYLANRKGEPLYVSGNQRNRILNAYRERDAIDLDAIDGLAILECAVFGQVIFG